MTHTDIKKVWVEVNISFEDSYSKPIHNWLSKYPFQNYILCVDTDWISDAALIKIADNVNTVNSKYTF